VELPGPGGCRLDCELSGSSGDSGADAATMIALQKNPSSARFIRSTTATPLALPVFSSTVMWRTIEFVRSVQCLVAIAAGRVDERELNMAPTEQPLPQLPQ